MSSFWPADIFRNQQLLKEYKDFWGNTKVSTPIFFGQFFCVKEEVMDTFLLPCQFVLIPNKLP